MKYVTPQSGLKSFTCPHCGVLARQYHWYNAGDLTNIQYAIESKNPVRVSKCEHCDRICLWYFETMVYPSRGNVPTPNPDMPEDAKKNYEEAASIYTQSPRGAAALLRLAIQKLCVDLGGKGKDLNEDIKGLVKKGLPDQVQKSLDIVRVIGNNAVHPGQIDVDNAEIAGNLFILLNLITDYMVSMPGKVEAMFTELPDSAKEQIEKRDGKT